MELGDVYSKQVKKSVIPNLSVGSHSIPPFERDPNLIKLESDVFSKLKSLIPKESQPIPTQKAEVKTFNLEDAIKELAEMQKK